MLPQRLLDSRVVRFLCVGVLNTGVGYLLFATLLFIGMLPLAAAAAATTLGALFNFASLGIVVFRNAPARLLPRFLGVYIGQYAINAAMLTLLERHGLGALTAQALLVPFLATGTYLAMSRLVFKSGPPAKAG